MDNIQAVERQIDRAIWALDYLKVDVNLHDVLYMLQYSHDERKLTIDSWSEYVKVSETLLKRIAVYEGQKKECDDEEDCEAQEPETRIVQGGTCWACGQYGKDMTWWHTALYGDDGKMICNKRMSFLIHKSPMCTRMAEKKLTDELIEQCTANDLTLDRFLDMVEERGLGSRLYTEKRSDGDNEYFVDVEKDGEWLGKYNTNTLHFFCERDIAKQLDEWVNE